MSCRFGGGSPTPLITSPFSVARGLLEEIAAALRLDQRVTVKLAEVLGNDRVLRLAELGVGIVVPGAGADAVARIDGGLAGAGLRAEVGAPGVIARADGSGQRLAMRVGSGEAAEIAAFAKADAGDEEGHCAGRRRATADRGRRPCG